MPTYDWKCDDDHAWSVVTTVALRNESSNCAVCGKLGVRQVTCAAISDTAKDWNRVSYNPGLGCWTKSWKHGREIAKQRGLEEIGNETPKTLQKSADEAKAARREKIWKDDGGPLL